MFRKFIDEKVITTIDRAADAQAPLAGRYLEFIARRHPADSREEIALRVQRQYLTVVTVSGVTVGLSAAVPGVGTLVGLAAAAADTVLFVEASVLFTLVATESAGNSIPPKVAAIILGQAGTSALGTAGRSAKQWDTVLASKIPGLSRVPDSPVKRFAVQFLVRRGALAFGKVIPAGIGAVIGGVGNRAMAHGVIKNVAAAVDTDTHGLAAVAPAT